ncbi:MAG: HAD family hydrolase [Planctomycetia bacterium]|nr:HAD family hydrolase [Planctomycetia bacterium]
MKYEVSDTTTNNELTEGLKKSQENQQRFRSSEPLKNIDTLVFDKTRTLVESRPRLITIETNDKIDKTVLLVLAASLEKFSKHPLGKAIVEEAIRKDLKLLDVKDFYSTTGKGVCGEINGQAILIGNKIFMIDAGLEIDLPKWDEFSAEIQRNGETVMYVAIEGEITGLFDLSDSRFLTNGITTLQFVAIQIQMYLL